MSVRTCVTLRDVFVQRAIKVVKLSQMPVGIYLRIDTGVILYSDATRQVSVWF